MPKKFIYKDNENDEVIFEGLLESRRCEEKGKNNHRCKKRCIIGVPYCWIHLQYKHHLKIKPSTIPEAGLGLFAWDNKSEGRPIFKKDQKIIDFIGEVITNEEKQERYGEYTAPYGLQTNENTIIDPALLRGVGSLANHKSFSTANAKFAVNQRTGTANLKAMKNIRDGDEIFVSYGNRYRFDENTTHKTINVKK